MLSRIPRLPARPGPVPAPPPSPLRRRREPAGRRRRGRRRPPPPGPRAVRSRPRAARRVRLSSAGPAVPAEAPALPRLPRAAPASNPLVRRAAAPPSRPFLFYHKSCISLVFFPIDDITAGGSQVHALAAGRAPHRPKPAPPFPARSQPGPSSCPPQGEPAAPQARGPPGVAGTGDRKRAPEDEPRLAVSGLPLAEAAQPTGPRETAPSGSASGGSFPGKPGPPASPPRRPPGHAPRVGTRPRPGARPPARARFRTPGRGLSAPLPDRALARPASSEVGVAASLPRWVAGRGFQRPGPSVEP